MHKNLSSISVVIVHVEIFTEITFHESIKELTSQNFQGFNPFCFCFVVVVVVVVFPSLTRPQVEKKS